MAPINTHEDEYLDPQSEFLLLTEWAFIEKYNLEDHPLFSEIVDPDEEYPEYVIRLLPMLRECCTNMTDGDWQYSAVAIMNQLEKPIPLDLDSTKFKSVFLILAVISYLEQDGVLSGLDDTRYIYVEMCTKFCEWLTSKSEVMEFFGQNEEIKSRIVSGVSVQSVAFEKVQYLESIKKSMRMVVEDFYSLNLEQICAEMGWVNFYEIDQMRFFRTISEWFDVASNTDIDLYFRNPEKEFDGIYSRGYKRFAEWGPRYRLMIYSSLIRGTYAQNCQMSFMFDKDIKLRLNDLVRLGHRCLEDSDVNQDFKDFRVGEIIYEFQHLSQVASLFLESTCKDVLHHCTSLERIHNGPMDRYINTFYGRSVSSKYAVVMSSLDRPAQIKFENMLQALDITDLQVTTTTQNMQRYAVLLKENLERAIDSISRKKTIGVSVVTRKYDVFRENQMALYRLFGIPTQIPSQKRKGRKTEVLFFHSNKNVAKIEAELNYLPKSLNTVMKLFSNSGCVILAPYLNLIALAHVVQFAKCMNSFGGYSDDEVISDFYVEILNIIGLLEKWEYKYSAWRLLDILHLFCFLDSEDCFQIHHKISRRAVVEMQAELKEIYDENFRETLHFPCLIPSALSPYFSF